MKIKMLFLLFSFLLGGKNGIVLGDAITLYTGGQNIGIEIRPDGLIISGTYDIRTKDGIYNPSKDSDIKKGDILFEVEGYKVSGLDDFSTIFSQKSFKNDEIDVKLKRNKISIKRKLRLIRENDRFKTGLYIKERILGIGTVSFYDEEHKVFGALGHGVIDNDSGNMVEVKSGAIYKSSVTNIDKSENGKPGAKVASLDLSSSLGTILENTSIGIYGSYNELPNGSIPLEMAYVQEVNLGKAEIYTVIKGNKIEKFEIEITALAKQETSDIKGITFKITDDTLLTKTGGVVAGMSGSPIIQNNKLVGAITHVLVDKVQYGYGIYIEWMYNYALKITNCHS